MKLLIFLALIGLAVAAPRRGRLVKKTWDELSGCWVVDEVITAQDDIDKIMKERGDSINHVDSQGNVKVGDVVDGAPIPCGITEMKGPDIKLPCAKINAPKQTKTVTRKPVFRGYAPITLDVDGVSWRCTHVGRSKTRSPCLPERRIVDRACEKTITPCEAQEIVFVDEPCVTEVIQKKTVIAPCETKIEKKIELPCLDLKLPEIKVSAKAGTASASVGGTGVSASAKVDMPKIDTVISDCGTGGSFSSSFKSSSSASASASASSSVSSSFSSSSSSSKILN